MTVPEWVTAVPATPAVHNEPSNAYQWQQLSQDELVSLRGNLIESIVSAVVQAIAGFTTLTQGAADTLAAIFTDLFDLLGNPLGLGTGDPTLTGDASQIPLLGPVLALIQDIPGLGDLLEIITGTEDGDLNDLATWVRGLLSGSSLISAGQITDTQSDLWPLGIFPDADSVAGNGIWVFDPEVSRTADSTGSVKVVADGTMKALRGVSTTVVPGQQFSPSVFMRRDGYAGTGTPVQFHVAEYIDDVLVNIAEVVVYGPPSASGGWVELTGIYTVPAGVNTIKPRLVVTDDATAGTLHFDDASPGNVTGKWSGLPSAVQEGVERWQLLVDSIFNAATGGSRFGALVEDVFDALKNINPANVGGVNGPDNIADSIREMLDSIVGGAVGQQGSGASNADAFNIFKAIGTYAGLGQASWDVLGVRDNSPVDEGLLPGSEANFNLTVANASLTVTPTVSLITTFRVKRSAPLGVVEWLGCGTSGVTAFYLNIRKRNVFGARELVFHSDNLVGDLIAGSTPGWESCVLDEPIARKAGEDYEYEFVTVGANHTIKGISFTDTIPDHPSAKSVAIGVAGRDHSSDPDNPTATIAFATVHSSPNVPWVSAAIDTGDDVNQRDPSTVYLTQAATIPIPNYVKYIHPVGLGAGGDGSAGLSFGTHGKPGEAGKWNATVWERDVHFTEGDSIDFDPASDDTESTVFTIIDTEYSLTAESGDDGTGTGIDGNWAGPGPAPLTFGEETYVGGNGQKAAGRDGVAPGGAGAGGSRLTGLFEGGGKGAPGAGWLHFIPGVSGGTEPDPLDTTPPTVGALTLDESTVSSLTVTASGHTD